MKKLVALSRNLSFQIEDETYCPLAMCELILSISEPTCAIDDKGATTHVNRPNEDVRVFISGPGLIELANYCTRVADELKNLAVTCAKKFEERAAAKSAESEEKAA